MHLPTFRARRLIGVAALACAAALIPVASTAATASPAGPGNTGLRDFRARCLAERPAGQPLRRGRLLLRKLHKPVRACTLHGNPRISAVSLSGRQLGNPATWGTVKKPVVRLANGATATAKLQIEDAGNVGRCFPLVTAAGLRVYPPNQTRSKVIPYPFTAYGHAGPVWMGVQPVNR